MADTKTAFCSVMEELPTNERHQLIREYLNSHKVSGRVKALLVSLMCEVA
ncbi:MAG: hypothetical protein HFG31_00140 [Eubacterium sp.]|nr:hypothetical protein [Eubacterium sp.]